MVWLRFKVFWLSKDNSTGHSERTKKKEADRRRGGTVKGQRKKRQTEEEVGRQYQKVDRNGLCQLNKGSLKQDKMERDSCEVICGARQPSKVMGYDRIYISKSDQAQ